MRKGFYTLLIAQALSSLADNALFIAAIELLHQISGPQWLDSALKWFFAAAYVVLAAHIGAIADTFPKGRVMFVTNGIKILGCIMMFAVGFLNSDSELLQPIMITLAYGLVGVGAAAYSPAKYGLVTELLHPKFLVRGNSWMEGLTVISIILGFMLGGFLINHKFVNWVLSFGIFESFKDYPAMIAILFIGLIYISASICNLFIPRTKYIYPKQPKNPITLIKVFSNYVAILWKDKVGQVSMAVTTLFWGAGAVVQLVVLKWGQDHLGFDVSESAFLMGIAAIGTVVGAVIAGRVPLKKAFNVLPVGVLMGLITILLIFVKQMWAVYIVLIFIGGLSGFFVVPMNAILQHRGHVLLSAGHSIAVQNFNEQLNILLFVALYGWLVHSGLHINKIIVIFGLTVSALMYLLILLYKSNKNKYPEAFAEIGSRSHGKLAHKGH
ncbi:putative MFS transporter [Taylorella asinigenitalis 14/45]|uniref:Putative MFS transporter n=1 Tax=Taylorella asinigenitalis 14/45 TaxID=1091495 RepID=I7IKM2_9BURK|nr:lysophospholipid transporter LplT [Taylorella asinigenitalis]CCG19333.1 putative MFS transporter [Taylorella asinigenitalis 14/45]